MLKNKIKFWTLFVILNCLLFLPKYLLEYESSTFFPISNLFQDSIYGSFKSLFVRYNFDIFRISIDLVLIVIVFYLLRKRVSPKKYARFAGTYYLFMLLFIVYYTVMEKLFLAKPVLYDDLYLFKLGFINTVGKNSFIFLLEIFAFLLIVWLFIKLFQYFLTMVSQIQFGKGTKFALIILGFFYLINTVRSGMTFEPHHTFQLTFSMIADNVKYSVQAYKNLHRFDIEKLNHKLNYDQYQLKKQPNVYFLFVESYGRIVYQNEKLRLNYIVTLDSCQNKLNTNGYHSYSAFSTSPVSGGGSWISYSSVMFGFNLKNQATYLSMVKNNETASYNHMFRWFNKKGYLNYRLVALPDDENLKVSWDKYTSFYAVDEWIRYKDLNYQGNKFGFGPSPPDQYSLNFGNEYIRKNSKTPYTLFFISQNSHTPFFSPDSLASDWRSLNNTRQKIEQKSVFLRNPKFEDYSKAIDYSLKMFAQFIISQGKENDIFILIGDHQPPFLTRNKDGFDTPVHIIVRDKKFGAGFSKYGFTPGMHIPEHSIPLRHEGIYSMFMREFIRNYGADTTHLPEYLPLGIQTYEDE